MNGNINSIYNINNNDINSNGAYNRIQNWMNTQYQKETLNKYILSNNNNVNKSLNNIDLINLYQNGKINNGFNHLFNYVNNINNELNNSINGNESNYLYNNFKSIKPK